MINFIKKIFLKFGYCACIVVFIYFIVSFVQGCKTYKPIQFKNECKECNDFYNIMKFYAEFDKTPDSAFIGTAYSECQKARFQKRTEEREKHCSKLFFENGIIDEKKYKQYNYYLKCVGGK